MAMSIVSMLLESGLDSLSYGSSITESEASSYTLESGAALMARKCAQELHEIFEVAVIETNEAALAAYMEGCTDVMESATYGAVFEASDNKAGNSIIEFLKKLKDRVFAFFKNIGAKISALLNNYDKFFKNNEEKMKKAEKERTSPIKVKIRNWNNTEIAAIPGNLKQSAAQISGLAVEIVGVLTGTMAMAVFDGNGGDKKKLVEAVDKTINDYIKSVFDELVPGLAGKEWDNTTLNEDCTKVFVGKGNNEITADVEYVSNMLNGAKKSLGDIKTAQKEFNDAYDKAIKVVKSITENSNLKTKAGMSAYLHKATSAMSKIQTVVNAYASAGYRAMVSRSNEAKALCGVIISGKVGKKWEGSDGGEKKAD